MKNRILISCWLLSIVLGGCATNQSPQIVYEDRDRPLGDTAVILTARENNGGYGLTITKVDGKPTSCFEVGCPVWVRITPGKHAVTFRYKGDFHLMPGAITFQQADMTAELNASARHVYIAEYEVDKSSVYVRLRDDGENSSAGVHLGLSQQKYPVKFD